MPTYRMVAGTYGPVTPGKISDNGVLPGATEAEIAALQPYVTVELPDDTPLDLMGHIDAAAMRRRYSAHSRFGSDSWAPPGEFKA